MKDDSPNTNRSGQRMPEEHKIRTDMKQQGGEGSRVRDREKDAPLAKDPSITRSQLADPGDVPADKEIPSALPGAEEEHNIGTVARGAAAGTKGASSSSEGKKGNPDHYGSNQTGPGLATGPMTTNPEVGNKKR